MPTHLKRVNVINSTTGVGYRATRYKAFKLVDSEGFHYTTKSKLKSLIKAQAKQNEQRRRITLHIKFKKKQLDEGKIKRNQLHPNLLKAIDELVD